MNKFAIPATATRHPATSCQPAWAATARLRRSLRLPSTASWAGACLLAVIALVPREASALNPDSPEVKALVAKALPFIKSNPTFVTGERALVGLTLLKADVPKEDIVIQQALETIKTARFNESNVQYGLGISLIFLATLDSVKYRPEIDKLLARMVEIQKPHGGWGYLTAETGDTSMTQYGVLSLWELDSRGIPTPADSWQRVINWLMRTQDPSGGFGYQGKDPGNMTLVAQTEVRNSLSAAGTGSLYIAADYLEIDPPKPKDKGIPDALHKVEDAAKKEKAGPKAVIDKATLEASMSRGDGWMNANYTISPNMHTHYYLYAFERYQSFKEMREGRLKTESTWYDEGVAYLTKTQQPDGTWQGMEGPLADTCFSILFLVRSSQKSIEKLKAHRIGRGTLTSDKGNLANLAKKMNQPPKELKGPAQELLRILADPKNPSHKQAIESFAEAQLTMDDATMSREAAQLRRLSKESTPEARTAAVRLLGRSRDMDNVPTLIFALGDEDGRVVLEAEKGLRFISRKFSGFGPDSIKPENRKELVRLWKRWYLAIRPDAEFED